MRFLALCFFGGEREVSFLFRLAGGHCYPIPGIDDCQLPVLINLIFFRGNKMQLRCDQNHMVSPKTWAMSIVRWNPGAVAPSFRSWVEDFFGDLKLFPGDGASLTPAVNIRETEDLFIVEMAAPGMKKEDFVIEIKEGILMISSEHKEEKEEKKENYTRKEFSYNKFSRSFSLPENVHSEKIKATYKEGLLLIELPKLEKSAPKVKKVTIS